MGFEPGTSRMPGKCRTTRPRLPQISYRKIFVWSMPQPRQNVRPHPNVERKRAPTCVLFRQKDYYHHDVRLQTSPEYLIHCRWMYL